MKYAVLAAVGLILCASIEAVATTVSLQDVDSGHTSPTGVYRWLDVADYQYADSYRADPSSPPAYNYTQATVGVTYNLVDTVLRGTLTAVNLKPNFAYQLKLSGMPDTYGAANERIGLAGRWWQEEWNGTAWSNGQNLNSKGDGSSPNPNDLTYFARRDLADPHGNSPTGKRYRYTGYLVFDYFITDQDGNAVVDFEADSSYHVLWKTAQRPYTPDDGPVKSATFDPDPSQPAYDTNYPAATVGIYGEWERLPVGGVYLEPGDYVSQIFLTEESFHGSGGTYAGGWAAAMGADLNFTIIPEPVTATGVLLGFVGLGAYLRRRRTAPRHHRRRRS